MNRIKWLLVAGAVVGAVHACGQSARAEEPAVSLETLDQKIRVIEKKLEIGAPASEEKKLDVSVSASQDGLSIKSNDGAFQARFKGVVQTDGRFYIDDQRNPLTNTFLVKRARPILDLTVFKDYDIFIVPDFGGGTAIIQDSYLDYHPIPQAKVRVGKFKEPFGLERLQSDSVNKFVELALPSALVPNRDIGLQVYGDFWGGALSYALGVFNGVLDGGSADADTNDSKDVAGRILAQPFKNTSSNWIKDFGFGVAATQGTQLSALPTYKTLGQQTFNSYLSTVSADGDHTRVSPQIYYYNGPFGLLSEYVVSSQEVKKGTGILKFVHNSWQVTASYLITGDKSNYNKGITPLKPFDWKAGQWGAWEVAARYGEFTADDDIFNRGVADPNTSASQAKEWATAINWYLNKNVKVVVNYGETNFEGGATLRRDREKEKVFLTRFQISIL